MGFDPALFEMHSLWAEVCHSSSQNRCRGQTFQAGSRTQPNTAM